MRSLRNTWPEWNEHNDPRNSSRTPRQPELPEAAAAPVPHAILRRLLREAEGFNSIWPVLRAQLCWREPREEF